MDNDSKTVESLYNNFIVEIENVFKKDSELYKKYFSGTLSVSVLPIMLNETNPATILFNHHEINNLDIVIEAYKKIGKYEYLFSTLN